MAFIPDPFAFADNDIEVTPTTRVAASQSFAMRCRDGKGLALHLSSLPKFWDALCEAIEQDDIRDDPRFATRALRYENYSVLAERLAEVFVEQDRDAWIERLSRFDIPFAPINSVQEVAEDPQVRHLATFYESRASDGTEVRSMHCPVWFDGKRTDPQGAPPMLGEHNDLYIRPPHTK